MKLNLLLWALLLFSSSVNAEQLHACKQVEKGNVFLKECKDIVISPKESAVVIVDLWDTLDTNESKDFLININMQVEKYRKLGMTIIHASGGAGTTTNKYLQFNKELRKKLGSDYCNSIYSSKLRKEMEEHRYSGKRNCRVFPGDGKKFSKYIIPVFENENEYIVNYEEEILYILYNKKIKNLLYVGSALDQCILNRDYGLLKFATNHLQDSNLSIYLLSEYIGVMNASSAIVNYEIQKQVFLNSLSLIPNIFYTTSKKIN